MASTSLTPDFDVVPSSTNESDITRKGNYNEPVHDIDISKIIYIPETPSQPSTFNIDHSYIDPIKEQKKDSVPMSSLNGVFSKISNTIQSFLPWRKTILKNSVSPESGTNILNSLQSLPNSSNSNATRAKHKTNDFQMNAFGQDKSNSSQPSLISTHNRTSECTPGKERNPKPEDFLSYDSKIYPVNSAGNPIPITIQNGQEGFGVEDFFSSKRFLFIFLLVLCLFFNF